MSISAESSDGAKVARKGVPKNLERLIRSRDRMSRYCCYLTDGAPSRAQRVMRHVNKAVTPASIGGLVEANVVAVNVEPFEVECTSGHGGVIRADVYLRAGRTGRVPVLVGASRRAPVHRIRADAAGLRGERTRSRQPMQQGRDSPGF